MADEKQDGITSHSNTKNSFPDNDTELSCTAPSRRKYRTSSGHVVSSQQRFGSHSLFSLSDDSLNAQNDGTVTSQSPKESEDSDSDDADSNDDQSQGDDALMFEMDGVSSNNPSQ